MDRAFAIIETRSVDYKQRVIEGIASTPSTDRMGDIVEPLGAKFSLPMPLLWQHDATQPVGEVTFAKPTKDGIPFKARIAKFDEPGNLKNRTDEAWDSVVSKLVRAVSIGFRPLDYEAMKDGGLRFKEWEWLELSLVTIPANMDAGITEIRSIDRQIRAASGLTDEPTPRPSTPGASGPAKPKVQRQRAMPKTVAEQISAFEATRAAKSARMVEIMEHAGEEDTTLDENETAEYDGLADDVKKIDAHLVRLRALEREQARAAVRVDDVADTESASAVRGGAVVSSVRRNLPAATAFTRYAIALARSKGNLIQAHEIAKSWDDTPEVEQVLKAAVNAGTTTDPAWAGPLVQYQQMASEFIELLRPATIIGRIPGLRRVPFNISMPAQSTGSTVGWVGEGAPKPVSALAFSTVTLRWAKAAGIVVLTDELVRFSNPSAEAIVRQDLTDAIAQFLDRQFVDPTVAEVANVSPASITNGAFQVIASGTDAAALRADLNALFAHFLAANLSLAGAVFIMTGQQALAISMMQNPLGQPEFPGITMTGGTLLGIPVVVSENIPPEPGQAGPPVIPAGSRIILAKAPEILLADDGGVTLDASREASLQMDSAPTNPPVANTVMVSLWQMNMVGLRAERFINWKRRRTEAVAYITGAAYTF
jgi:HK97 family phage major capsid protein/HK97 family phage prohead protease